MRAKKWGGVGLAVLTGGLLLYYAAFYRGGGGEAVPKSFLAADFRLPDATGRTVALSDFRGKVVLLDFWATWCGPCVEEMPGLVALQKKYESRGFTVVGVAMDSSGASVVVPFLRDNPVPYPILISGGDLPADYPVPGFPTAFLIDKKGAVVERFLGELDFDEASKSIESLL